jgi:hypothetical protein
MGAEDISNIDVDGLLAQANTPHEMPMGDDVGAPQEQAPEPQAPQQAQAPAPEQVPTPAQMERLVIDGQEIQATKEQLVKWAQMGYSAPNKIGQIKQEYEAKFKPYLEVDQFARENPEWWQQVQDLYAQREALRQKADPNNPLTQELSQVKNQLQELSKFKNEILQERTQAQHKQEDDALDTEIKSIREKFADLDWNTANEQGHNLERQVLTYATQRGIGNFQDAFRAFIFDKAVVRAEERGKESVGKTIQKQVKAGIIGKSPTPTQGIQSTSVKGKSYEDLLNEAKQELGL